MASSWQAATALSRNAGTTYMSTHPVRIYWMSSNNDSNREGRSRQTRSRHGTGPRSWPRQALDWMLIFGNRRMIAVLLLVGVYATFLILHALWPIRIQTLLTEEETIQGLLQTLLSGDVLLVSIVVSVNSLVVSQELTPIGDQHERVIESWNFREESERAIGDVSPATPAEFLRQIAAAIERELDELSEHTDEMDEDTSAEIDRLVEALRDHMQGVQGALLGAEDGWFKPELFTPALDPSEGIDRAMRLQERADDFPDAVETSLTDILQALQYFSTAREYFKTIYYKQEFSRLSRDLLYTGLPTILLLSYLLLAIRAEMFPGSTFGVNNLFLFFSLAYTAALAPFLVLTGYVLRTALIAEQTVSAGAFVVD